MKPPAKIRVGHADYRVETVKELDGGETMGQFLRDQGIINMVLTSPVADANTLLHEVLHAAFGESGLDHGVLSKHEERIVSALTNQLLQIIRDNPKLVSYLTKAIRGK